MVKCAIKIKLRDYRMHTLCIADAWICIASGQHPESECTKAITTSASGRREACKATHEHSQHGAAGVCAFFLVWEMTLQFRHVSFENNLNIELAWRTGDQLVKSHRKHIIVSQVTRKWKVIWSYFPYCLVNSEGAQKAVNLENDQKDIKFTTQVLKVNTMFARVFDFTPYMQLWFRFYVWFFQFI